MKKSELQEMIRDILREELSKRPLKESTAKEYYVELRAYDKDTVEEYDDAENCELTSEYGYSGTKEAIINKLNQIAQTCDFSFVFIYEGNPHDDICVFNASSTDVDTDEEFDEPVIWDNKLITTSEPFMKTFYKKTTNGSFIKEDIDTVTIMAKSVGENISVAKKDVALARKIDRKAHVIWHMGENRDEDSMCAKYGIQNWSGVELFDKFASEAGLNFDLVEDDYNTSKPTTRYFGIAKSNIGYWFYSFSYSLDAAETMFRHAIDKCDFDSIFTGGPITIYLYEYTGEPDLFDTVESQMQGRHEGDEKARYKYKSITDAGFELKDCKLIKQTTVADLNEEFNFYENMWDKEPMVEAVQSADMYIVAADGDAGGSLYYIGNSKADAQKEYKSVAKDWRAFGLGGGDTPVCLYKYFGPTDIFDDIRARWEKGETFDYSINIEEFGISLDNCDVLASEWGD